MALAAPTNVTISDKTLVFANTVIVSGVESWVSKLRATVNWTNNESANHVIEVYVNDKLVATCQKGTTSAIVLLSESGKFSNPLPSNTIKLRAVNTSGDTSTYETITVSIFLFEGVGFPTPYINNRDIAWNKWQKTLAVTRFPGAKQAPPEFAVEMTLTDLNNSTIFSKQLTTEEFLTGKLPLPSILIEGNTYILKYSYFFTDGFVSNYPGYGLNLQTASSSFYFTAPAAPEQFTAENKSVTTPKNQSVSIRLDASHPCSWQILSGAPAGFSISRGPIYDPGTPQPAVYLPSNVLSGIPTVAGNYNILLRATRISDSATANATVTLTVLSEWPKTTVAGGDALIKDGLKIKAGEPQELVFVSTPSEATWTATGLPTGLVMANGRITGKASKVGVFYVSIRAKGFKQGAIEYAESEPLSFKMTVTVGGVTLDDGSAAARSPWLLTQWELIDLHVLARTREVQSTRFTGGKLWLKLGDTLTFAVLFVDAFDAVFAMENEDDEIEQLRLTIRRDNNLDDILVFKTASAPVAQEQEGQTYYLLEAVTGDAERELALEWIEEKGKNEPLPCAADLDWTIGGKTYSSKTFPVLLDLDVTRP